MNEGHSSSRAAIAFIVSVLATVTCLTVAYATAAPGHARTHLVSVGSSGALGNGATGELAISRTGRYVAFASEASNLVAGDTNGVRDIFVRDRQTGKTRRISVSTSGRQANGASTIPTISANGRYVSFDSDASNLVPGDTNGATDSFLRDLRTGRTTRLSVSSSGVQGNATSWNSFMSQDGRFVVFQSSASNLVRHDTNGVDDVFARDLKTGRTKRVSISSSGTQGNGPSADPAVSDDGTAVYQSTASNLVGGDTNAASDIFGRSFHGGKTKRLSLPSSGAQANGDSYAPEISSDASELAFGSLASNLVGNDTNGVLDIFARNLDTGKTVRVSVSSSGAQANGPSGRAGASVALDRYVAFNSFATNLIAGGTTAPIDTYVHDLRTGRTRLVSVSSSGALANGPSVGPRLSADGRFAAYNSFATNLVGGDTNGLPDEFVTGPLR